MVVRAQDVTLECFHAGRLGRNVRKRSVCMPNDGIPANSVNLSPRNVLSNINVIHACPPANAWSPLFSIPIQSFYVYKLMVEKCAK